MWLTYPLRPNKIMATKSFANVEIIAVANNEVRNAAFAKGVNRDVNLANAKKICADIKAHGFRQAELIQVLPAEIAIVNGDITLVDINNNTITAESAKNYYLVLDGQHRIFATSSYNKEKDVTPIQVPAIIVNLNDGETVAEYISAINVTKAEWKPLDYVRGAANVMQKDLLLRYKELIKCEDNPDGYSLSTLNIIFCGNAKAMSKTDLSLLCQGKQTKGVKKAKSIIPAYSLERGNRFINLCIRKGFTNKDIAKRYLAEQFQDFRQETNDDRAFELFEAVTQNDRKAMYNEKGSLMEDKVDAQFKIIKGRMAK